MNTVCIRNGTLHGYNTDVIGFKDSLGAHTTQLRNRTALIAKFRQIGNQIGSQIGHLEQHHSAASSQLGLCSQLLRDSGEPYP